MKIDQEIRFQYYKLWYSVKSYSIDIWQIKPKSFLYKCIDPKSFFLCAILCPKVNPRCIDWIHALDRFPSNESFASNQPRPSWLCEKVIFPLGHPFEYRLLSSFVMCPLQIRHPFQMKLLRIMFYWFVSFIDLMTRIPLWTFFKWMYFFFQKKLCACMFSKFNHRVPLFLLAALLYKLHDHWPSKICQYLIYMSQGIYSF